jgi:PA14 domain/Bacterial Ig domain
MPLRRPHFRYLVLPAAFIALVITSLAGLSETARAVPGCPASYPTSRFTACYYDGVNGSAGPFLGKVNEPLAEPPYPRRWAINREWGDGQIIAGTQQDTVSGVWKGSFEFDDARYLFSLFNDDGVRFYIDDHLVLNEWVTNDQTEFSGETARYAVARHMTTGVHQLRVEWFENTGAAQMRLNWDKGPQVGSSPPRPLVIDAFILKRQDVCIAGEQAPPGTPAKDSLSIYEPNGQPFQTWLASSVKVYKKSQEAEARASHPLVWCFAFGLDETQEALARAQLQDAAAYIQQWSFGSLVPEVQVTELQGETLLTRSGGGFWVSGDTFIEGIGVIPSVLAPAAKPHVTTDTDFILAFPGARDVGSTNPDGSFNTGRYYSIPNCAFGLGADPGLWSAGYAWISDSCTSAGTVVSELGHSFRCAIRCIMQYAQPELFDTQGHFPACRSEDSTTYTDSFRFYPSHYNYWRDPVGPWCGWPGAREEHINADPENNQLDPGEGVCTLWCVPDPKTLLPGHPDKTLQLASNLMWHYDPTLASYQLNFFTGNHCNDGRHNPDWGETGVDTGVNCPKAGQTPTVSISPPLPDGAPVSGVMQFTATTESWVKEVRFSVNGQLAYVDTAAPFTFSWDIRALPEGSQNELTAVATDWEDLSATESLQVVVCNSGGCILPNGSFEEGTYSPTAKPDGWNTDMWFQSQATFTWDTGPGNSVDGTKSVQINATGDSDAYWLKAVTLYPNTDYVLSGWIKTANVTGDDGATLGIFGRWERSAGVRGTNGWTYVTFPFNSGSDSVVEIAARLGFWSSASTGTAWFDDLRVELGTRANIVANSSFEQGVTSTPFGWNQSALDTGTATFSWESGNGNSVDGTKSIKIEATALNDAYWSQRVAVKANTDYVLSGWIKAENVVGGAGANLGIFGRFEHSEGKYQTNGWTYVEFRFNSGSDSVVEIAARIGHWGDVSAGTAWFDGLTVIKAGP